MGRHQRVERAPTWRAWAIHAVMVTFPLTFVAVCETMLAMILHRFWRLRESSDDNLGLACTNDGLVLGRTALIERRDNRFIVRERNEIERLLARAYQIGVVVDRLTPGLTTVASALNANDPCLARIAAVHLRVPDLPAGPRAPIWRRKTSSLSRPIGSRRSICATFIRRARTIPSIPAGRRARQADVAENSAQRTDRTPYLCRRSKTASRA